MEEHFYQLLGPVVPLERDNGPVLAMAEFGAATGYESARIAYRVSDSELRYYAYHKWTAEPAQVVAEMVARHLRASGLFAEVGRSTKNREPDAVLDGTVVAMEEVDEGESWKARLAMVFVLRRPDTDAVLLRHGFNITVPCSERSPAAVARGLSEILSKELKTLGPRLAQAARKPVPIDTP